jgi:hypothetical protein
MKQEVFIHILDKLRNKSKKLDLSTIEMGYSKKENAIDFDSIYPEFEKNLKTYSKRANIPGFRQGMVPIGMVKKMYGQSLFAEEVIKNIEKGLNEYLSKESLEIFAQPLPLSNKDFKPLMDQPQNYQFEFEIGLKPSFEINLNKTKAPFYKVKVTAEMINEEVDVEQAEVVMAVRALADDVQDQIERSGRMMNEDVPAIADKMRGEMGAQAAQSFVDSVNGLLATHIEATKSVKAGLDSAVGSMTGEEMVGGLGDTGELGTGGLAEPDMPEEEPTMDVNEPAAAGPEEEPLGRAEV